ncbi:MAG: TlyA family RNA methyltransferase [Clostridia bacterium]|jgi:23S rRNA (cytidine1920-2'-O)/16S rRNA (cytidine1409-2'-O)-methyltransferase
MSDKKRLDTYLVENGHFDSREKAKRVIMSGVVYVNKRLVDKPGYFVGPDDLVRIKDHSLKYVSRGGVKLEKALREFHVEVKGKTVLDCGASTGGFTDCLLQAGAKKVYAVDVGYGQLDWKIRQDRRVVVMERTNARYLSPEDLGEQCHIATIDVSFISLQLILPAVKKCIADGGDILALIKPQFEAGKDKVGKKGVVRQPEIHREVLQTIVTFCKREELFVADLSYSPITGPQGNIEFLIHLKKMKGSYGKRNLALETRKVVEEAHKELQS